MAAVLLQTSSVERSLGSGTTQTFTFASAVPSGSAVIVPFVNYPGGAVTGVTDNQGNTYSLAQSVTDSQNRSDIWYKLNIASDNTTPLVVTATFSAGGNYNTGAATAWSGLSALDKLASSTNSPTVTAASANTTLDSIAIVSCVTNGGFSNGNLSLSAGWNTIWRENDSSSYEGGQAGWKAIAPNEVATQTSGNSFGGVLNNVLATFTVTPTSSGMGTNLTSVASLTANLSTSIRLAENLTSSASLTSALNTSIRLASGLNTSATTGFNLSTAIRLATGLSSSASLTSGLQTSILLGSNLSGNSTLTSSLTVGSSLGLNLLNSSAIISNLSTSIRLQTSLNATSTFTSNLSTSIRLGTSLAGSSTLSTNLSTGIRLAQSISSVSTLTPSLSSIGQITLGSNLSGISTLSASLLTGIRLSSGFLSLSSFNANITTGVRLATSLVSGSGLSFSLQTAIPLYTNLQTASLLSGKFGEYFVVSFTTQSSLVGNLGTTVNATKGIKLIVQPDNNTFFVSKDNSIYIVPVNKRTTYIFKERDEYAN